MNEKHKLYIKSKNSSWLLTRLSFKTDWLTMSEKKIRYFSEKPFATKCKSISWALEIEETMVLIWDSNRREIYYEELMYYTADKLLFWILHTFLPLVLELDDKYKILHMGSVEVREKAILFSALSYGGKSTLTDYFLKKGHALIGDDTVALEKKNNKYSVISSYPYYRPYREVGTLGFLSENYSLYARELQCIYVLKKVESKESVNIQKICGVKKFKALHLSSYIFFDYMQEERFSFFSRISSLIDVYEISVPWELSRLNEVYEMILLHTQKMYN